MRFGRFGRIWKDESGQALVIATLSMAVLMGFLALAVDVGLLFHARRNVQLAADAAAVAAALDYKYNGNIAFAQAAGRAAATANGIANAATNVRVFVPPADGTFAGGLHGGANYAEVIIRQPMSTTFTNFLNITNLSIAARAVAGPELTDGCIWALKTTGVAVSVSGSISDPTCNIYDNAAWNETSGSVTASKIGIAGAYSGGFISPNPPTTGMTQVANPLNLTAPSPLTTPCPGGNCIRSYPAGISGTLTGGRYTSISAVGTATGGGTVTFAPGNYTITDGLSITGTKHAIFGAGVYVVEGGLTLSPSGAGHIVADGVTFYVKAGTTSISTATGGSLTITGPANGVALFGGDSSAITITANAGMTFDGIVYAPAAPLTLGGSGATISTDLIVDSLSVTGGPKTIANYAAVTNTNSVLNKIRMVE